MPESEVVWESGYGSDDVQRVQGVKGIAVELDVKLDPNHNRSDTDIAAAAEAASKWHSLIPADRIKVKGDKGWLILKPGMPPA